MYILFLLLMVIHSVLITDGKYSEWWLCCICTLNPTYTWQHVASNMLPSVCWALEHNGTHVLLLLLLYNTDKQKTKREGPVQTKNDKTNTKQKKKRIIAIIVREHS